MLIYCSNGGYGHRAASEALSSYLGDRHTVEIVDTFGDVLASYDPVRKLSFGRTDSDKIYNYLMARESMIALYLIGTLGSTLFTMGSGTIIEAFRAHVLRKKPKLLISTIPVINFALHKISAEFNIPLLIVTTDWGVKHFLNRMPVFSGKNNRFTLPASDPYLLDPVRDRIAPELISYPGYPLRKPFLVSRDQTVRSRLRKELSLPEGAPVALVMFGGQGGKSLIRYCTVLASSDRPLTILCCVGMNQELRTKMAAVKTAHTGTQIRIFSFVDAQKIAELMSAADVVVSKAGGSSVAESLSQNTPMLLDKNSSWLPWERANREWACKRGFARTVQPGAGLLDSLKSILETPRPQFINAGALSQTGARYLALVDEVLKN